VRRAAGPAAIALRTCNAVHYLDHMAVQRRFPVPVAPLGRVAIGNALRDDGGERRLTIYIKACFKLVHSGPMSPLAPDPIRLEGRSLARDAKETAVVVVGAAATEETQRVRLVSTADDNLLDAELPVGLSRQADDAGAGEAQLEMPELDAWLWLDGMGPEGEPLRTQLPGVIALARLWADHAPTDEKPALRAIRIDRDRGRCALVWGAELVVGAEGDPSGWLLAATLAFPAIPHRWPARSELEVGVPVGSSLAGTVVLGKSGSPDEPPPSSQELLGGTMSLSQTQHARAGSDGALPFADAPAPGSRPSPSAPIPGAPWAEEAAVEPPPISHAYEGTVAVGSPSDELRAAQEEAARRQEAAEEAAAAKAAAEAEAERQRIAKVDEERLAEEAAAKTAAAEAAERQAQEEEKFRQEQVEALRAEAERAKAEAEQRKEKGKKLRTAMYGFAKKKK